MVKIYLSPSDQRNNIYACDGKTSEAEVCRKIANALAKHLENDKNFMVKVGSESIGYVGRVSDSNSWGANMHIPIHTNAGGGSGTVIFTYDYSGEGYKLGQKICEYLEKITKRKHDIRQYKNLYEISKTYAACCYVEVDFHDNKNISKWLIDNVENIAKQMYLAICDFYGVTAEVGKETENKKVFWRVFAGAKYAKMADAGVIKKKMEEKGIASYVGVKNGKYVCYVGSFKKKENAKKMKKKVIDLGIPAHIEEVEGSIK